MAPGRLRAIAFITATTSAACGLSLAGDLGANDAGAPPTEADALAGADAPENADARADATADANPIDAGDVFVPGCVTVVQGFPAGEWEALGVAVLSPTAVVLTAPTTNMSAGAAWYKAPITFTTTLRVIIDYVIETPNGPAGDGLTVAWIETIPKYALGQANQNFGLCNQGLVGTAIAADSLDGRLIGLAGCAANCQTSGAIVTAPTVGSHKLAVTVSATQIVGLLDSSHTVTRARANAKTGYLGLTASTGNGDSRHTITSVRVDSCP